MNTGLEKAIRIIEREMDKMSAPKVPERPAADNVSINKVANGYTVTVFPKHYDTPKSCCEPVPEGYRSTQTFIAADARALMAVLTNVGMVTK